MAHIRPRTLLYPIVQWHAHVTSEDLNFDDARVNRTLPYPAIVRHAHVVLVGFDLDKKAIGRGFDMRAWVDDFARACDGQCTP
jgi:hypothetical protein